MLRPRIGFAALEVLSRYGLPLGTVPSRSKSTSTPLNTVVLFVPQQEAWTIERMGKFHRILAPGLNFLVPIIDKVKYVNSLKEIAIDIPQQTAITKDNVALALDGVLYLRIVDPYHASYGVEDPGFAVTQLAQTTMRSELGKIALDTIFRERENLNIQIVDSINKASEAWGLLAMRYEIRDIKLPSRIQDAMQMQVEAERRKRAQILESEGTREAAINVAEGQKQARILASEAEKQEKINFAIGEAQALLNKAEARAKSIEMIGKSLGKETGKNASSLIVAEQYVKAFAGLAKNSNTILLPSDASNVPGMVTQAMTIYKQLTSKPKDISASDELDEYFSEEDDRVQAKEGKKSN